MLSIRTVARIMTGLLISQFLLGMFANLFVTFGTSTNPNPLATIFVDGSPVLIAHVLIATALFIFAMQPVISAAIAPKKPLAMVASVGFASVALAFFSGILFVYSGYENDSLSYLMAVGFLLAFTVYPTFAVGNRLGEASRTTESGFMNAHSIQLTVLQLVVGGIVVFGGIRLVTTSINSVNSALGAITIVLGLLALTSAYATMKLKNHYLIYARLVNAAIIMFSIAQESFTVATSSGINIVAGSLGGTVIAIGIALGVVLNLPSQSVKVSTSPASTISV